MSLNEMYKYVSKICRPDSIFTETLYVRHLRGSTIFSNNVSASNKASHGKQS